MPQPARTAFDDAFGELDLGAEAVGERQARTVYPPGRERRESDIRELTVPPDERPSRDNLPSSIEEAVLAVLDQVPRMASERPPAGAVDATAARKRIGNADER
jgi:hypothetical protein